MARLSAADGMRSAEYRARTEAFREHFAELLEPLPDDEAERYFALLRHLVSSTTWLTLRDGFRLSPDDTSHVMAWGLETLLEDLRQRTDPDQGR